MPRGEQKNSVLRQLLPTSQKSFTKESSVETMFFLRYCHNDASVLTLWCSLHVNYAPTLPASQGLCPSHPYAIQISCGVNADDLTSLYDTMEIFVSVSS